MWSISSHHEWGLICFAACHPGCLGSCSGPDSTHCGGCREGYVHNEEQGCVGMYYLVCVYRIGVICCDLYFNCLQGRSGIHTCRPTSTHRAIFHERHISSMTFIVGLRTVNFTSVVGVCTVNVTSRLLADSLDFGLRLLFFWIL